MKLNTAQIADMADNLRAMLGEDYDDQTFLDTLEGETDALEIADRLISDMLDAEALADAIRAQINELTARRDRMDSRAAAYRAQLLGILNATGLPKMERPRATISKRKGTASVKIVDEEAIPSQLWRVAISLDKAAIKAQLHAGEAVPGAILETGPDSLSVRTK